MRAPLVSTGGSLLPHLLLPAVQIFVLALPPFKNRALIFVPIICGLVFATWTNLFTSEGVPRAILVSQWPWYLGTISKLIFDNPEKDYWRSDRKPHEAENMPFWAKLKWSAALYCSPRGIGWNYQVKGVPAYKAPRTKASFLLNQAIWLAVVWLAIDALHVYYVEAFYGGQPEIMTMPLIETGGQHLGQRALNGITTTLAAVYLPVQNLYTVIAVFSVILGGGAPKDWPPIYGSNLMEMTTLRKFWNTFWHQVIRKTFLDWSSHLCNMLGIKRGTWLSTYFLLYFTFFMTAVGHGLGTYVIPYGPHATFDDRFYAWVRFFMRHAIAIHFEDFVIWCYKQVAHPDAITSNGGGQPDNRDIVSKRWHRVVGRVWVAGWWLYAMDWAMQAVLRTGVLAESPLPFSVWRPLFRAFGVI